LDPFELFWIVWLLVLPILGILFCVFAPVFWFFIVPKVARMLTWKRFQKVSFRFICDDQGYSFLVPSSPNIIPEGVVKTKNFGYRLLPRASSNPNVNMTAQRIVLKKYIWADIGKPIYFGHAGKVGDFSPATLAILEQTQEKDPISKPEPILKQISDYVKTLPKTLTLKTFGRDKTFNLRQDLTNMLKSLQDEINVKELTVFDPALIKPLLEDMYTPTQLDALATSSEQVGLKLRGKEYGRLILGGGLIIGLVILGIVAMVMLMK
jgi:hypothetical protein